MLVDGEGNEIIDFAKLEPWKYFVKEKRDGLLYPVLTVTYKFQSVEIEWATEDKETILRNWKENWKEIDEN